MRNSSFSEMKGIHLWKPLWNLRIAQLEQQMLQLQSAQPNMGAQAATFEKKLDYLNNQVEKQNQQFAHTLDTKLAEQMSRVENLLSSKKSRME